MDNRQDTHPRGSNAHAGESDDHRGSPETEESSPHIVLFNLGVLNQEEKLSDFEHWEGLHWRSPRPVGKWASAFKGQKLTCSEFQGRVSNLKATDVRLTCLPWISSWRGRRHLSLLIGTETLEITILSPYSTMHIQMLVGVMLESSF